MSTIEPTPAEVIAAAVTYEKTGFDVNERTIASVAVDALKAAGYAIVALPEPDEDGDYGHNVVTVGDDPAPEVSIRREWLSPSDAIETGAALIAAGMQFERAA